MTLVLRVRNANAAPLAVQLVTRSQAEARQRLEYLAIGVTLGLVLLVVTGCLVQAWVYRERDYAGYAVYAALLVLMVSANTGVAGEFLWGEMPRWGDPAKNGLPVLCAGMWVLFMSRLCRLPQREPWLARLALGVALAVALIGWPGSVVPLVMLGMAASAAIVPVIAVYTWRRGDAVGAWVLASYLPLVLATLPIVARMVGLPVMRFSAYGLLSAALVCSMPLLMVALTLRSRDLHALRLRERELTTHDPLTGLLSPHLMADRLGALLARHRRRPTEAAVLAIRLVNAEGIARLQGSAVADQALIRAAIKLRAGCWRMRTSSAASTSARSAPFWSRRAGAMR